MSTFKIGDRVTKIKGSQWTGRVVGTYSTELTPEGYAVESVTEKGSVQIYPAAALELFDVDKAVREFAANLKERPALTDWFPAHINPVRDGEYEVDVSSLLGVWRLRFENGEWQSRLFEKDRFTRWRGLANDPEAV